MAVRARARPGRRGVPGPDGAGAGVVAAGGVVVTAGAGAGVVATGGAVTVTTGGAVTVTAGGCVTVRPGTVVVCAGAVLSEPPPPKYVVLRAPAISSGTVKTSAAMTNPSSPVTIARRQRRAPLMPLEW